MYLLLAGLGFLLIPVSLVLLLIFLIRKRPKKIPFLLLTGGLVLVVSGSLMMPEADRIQTTSPSSVPVESVQTAQPEQSKASQAEQSSEAYTPKPIEQPTATADPLSYVVVSTQDYIRDGQKCIAYRIVCSPDLTKKQMIKIYNLVIDGDGKYLHTVWMYTSASDADGSGFYDIAMLEELEQGKTPEITLA